MRLRSERQDPVKFPSLRKLAIEGWVFDHSSDRITCAELLKICLKDRRKQAAVSALSLTECRHITEDDVRMLERFVKKVTWGRTGKLY